MIGPGSRWLALLVASYAFYATLSPFLPIVLAAVTLISFWAGLALEAAPDPSRRRSLALWVGVLPAAGALVVLKYTGFLGNVLEGIASLATGQPRRGVMNPFVHVGVSYWTLQAIAYVVDVAHGVVPAERRLGRYALYLAFFAKIVQGPIERPGQFLSQLQAPPRWSLGDLRGAIPLVLWGAFQKLVVADRLAPFVAVVFDDPAHGGGLATFVATYLFAAQIFFDFSGYTCIAIGIGRACGVRLSPNFDAPYASTSVAEFWRRWHISFSSWLLDYVFKPVQLGLRRWRTWGTPVALLLTFAVSGIWHGATWGFVAWGVLHGVYLSVSVLLARPRKRARALLGLEGWPLYRPLQILFTFHLVCAAWVLFRAPTVEHGLTMLARALTGLPASARSLVQGDAVGALVPGHGTRSLALVLALVAMATLLPRWFPELRTREAPTQVGGPSGPAPWMRAVVYSALFYGVAFLGGTTQAFIYARF